MIWYREDPNQRYEALVRERLAEEALDLLSPFTSCLFLLLLLFLAIWLNPFEDCCSGSLLAWGITPDFECMS